MSDFFRKHGLILSEVFWHMPYGKEQESGKIFHNHAKTSSSSREDLTVETLFFSYREI